MENQNGFDLEAALLAWRQDCASRPGISAEDAKELESDLRERVTDFLKQDLSEKEAFSTAARQLGPPRELAREFGRENPLPVYRERLFWMVWAGFAVSVWPFMTGGTLLWLVNTFGVLLPLPGAAWLSLAGHLPVLGAAILLATGKADTLLSPFQALLQSRRRLALAGVAVLLAGVLVRVFGPAPLALPGGWSMGALFLLSLSAWPLLLLTLGVALLRPNSAVESARLELMLEVAPAAVWRDRVFWMVVGGLLVGFWQQTSQFGVTALFSTGDVHRPFGAKPLVLMGVYQLIQLSGLLVLGLFVAKRLRAQNTMTAGTRVHRKILWMLLPAVACAWGGLVLGTEYLWLPKESSARWGNLVVHYFVTVQWLWPAGLAALALWLAPEQPEQEKNSVPAMC